MSKIFTITEGLQNLGALKTGGQGSVYKGMRMGEVYSAIKIIPTPIHQEEDSDKNYRNFRSEVEKLQQVNIHPSPYVVKILSSGITGSGSFPFIEMEYIDGPELAELLLPPHQKVFMLKELLKVAQHLSAALSHCHEFGVKHGDIKSNNVKYNTQTGNYVLLDFGLAIMSEEQRRTSVRHAGAAEFMAPEQHEGKMLLQTDIYSYGIILFELLSGQVPFPLTSSNDTGRNQVMLSHLEKQIPDAMAIRKNNLTSVLADDALNEEMQVPAWLIKVIERCLEKDPAKRYASGMELQNAITMGIRSGTKEMSPSENTSPNEALYYAAKWNAEKQKIEILEKELAMLKPMALSAGIKYNELTGDYQKVSFVRKHRTAFIGWGAACMLIIAFLSYSLVTTKEIVVSSPSASRYQSPFELANQQYQKSLIKAKQDSISSAKLLAEKKVMSIKKNKQKKKKKFLGIF